MAIVQRHPNAIITATRLAGSTLALVMVALLAIIGSQGVAVAQGESEISISVELSAEEVAPDQLAGVAITVTNEGSTGLSEILVTSPACEPASDGVTTLAAGASVIWRCLVAGSSDITIDLRVVGTDPDGETVTDTTSAKVAVVDPDAPTTTAQPTTTTTEPEATTTTTEATTTTTEAEPEATTTTEPVVSADGELSLSMLSDIINPIVGDTVVLRHVVGLTGSVAVSDISVTNDSCDEVTLRSGDGNRDNILTSNEQWTFECSAVVTLDFTSSAVVAGTTEASIPFRSAADLKLDVAMSALSVTKTVVGGPGQNLAAGDPVTYSYEVADTGDTTLEGVRVEDPDFGFIGQIEGLQAGQTETLTHESTVGDDGVSTSEPVATATDPLGRSVSSDAGADAGDDEDEGDGEATQAGGSDDGPNALVPIVLAVALGALACWVGFLLAARKKRTTADDPELIY